MNGAPRVIAFYLPQFHPIPENDAWWGAGFTEWTNVAKAFPNFPGHWQPHRPGELGFYDLRVPEVREAQAALARSHGIDGFCYYWYWFNGKRLLHRPLDEVIASGTPDFPFCICWANENWTRRWDGKDHEVLMAQSYSLADSAALIDALMPIFGDRRYLRVNGRPLFLVYRADLIPDARAHVALWRERCRAAGMADPYLAAVQNALVRDPTPLGFDAAVEFPPTDCAAENQRNALSLSNPDFCGIAIRYAAVAADYLRRGWSNHRVFRGVTPMWDNTARRQNDGAVLFGSSPELYGFWLERALQQTRLRHRGDERMVFVNAWNEWAEGNHLEPDARFGRQYLEATREAIARARAPFPARPTWDEMVAAGTSANADVRVERFGTGAPPAVSVVMPIYNHAKFLPQTLASIAEQRDVDLELVAVDDGSTDAGADVVAAFARTAGFAVTLIRQPNAGAPRALNRGMIASRAASIALINSDDVYAPSRLQRMLRALADSGSRLAFSDVEFIDDEGRTLGDPTPRVAKMRAHFARLASESPVRVLVQVNVGVSTGNLVFRRSLVERIGGFADLAICHDWDFLLAATYATDVVFVPERLYRYRLHARNTQGEARLQGQFEGEIVLARFLAGIRSHPMADTPGALDAFLDYARRVGLAPYIADSATDPADSRASAK